MHKLIRGIRIFRSKYFPAHRDLFKRLAEGQHPEALLITCSDSRIDPNLLTQTKPGDLFVVRNAGNIVPPYGSSNGGEEATVEYALGALGVSNIIVCGHSDCGAMKGLLHPEHLTSMPLVKKWLCFAEPARRQVEAKLGNATDEQRVAAAVRENVIAQIENLRTYPMVASRLAEGRLRLDGWIYDIPTGDVLAYSSRQGGFVSLLDAVSAESIGFEVLAKSA